jgi:hypothetical protein
LALVKDAFFSNSKNTPLRFRTTVLILFLFAITHTVKAQHYPHFTMWSRVQLSKEPSDTWRFAGTLLWRRQNNHQINLKNPLTNHLLIGGQGLITYRNPKNTVWVHIAQLTYMVTNQLLGKDEDFNAPVGKEFRYAGGVELNALCRSFVFIKRIFSNPLDEFVVAGLYGIK